VLHDLTVPVWTGSHLQGASGKPYRTILAAVDTTEEAEVVMRAAAALAKSYDASLSLASVLEMPPVSVETAYGQYLSDYTAGAEARLGSLKAQAGVTAPCAILNGPVAYAIDKEATRLGADLIVTGRGEVLGTISRMWSHLYPIVRHAPCPVLSI
jgi:nucleotide-binding universal stress UspA family protein